VEIDAGDRALEADHAGDLVARLGRAIENPARRGVRLERIASSSEGATGTAGTFEVDLPAAPRIQ
jgi:hypothetical protein